MPERDVEKRAPSVLHRRLVLAATGVAVVLLYVVQVRGYWWIGSWVVVLAGARWLGHRLDVRWRPKP